MYLQNTIYFKNHDIYEIKKKFPFIKYVISWICTPLKKDIISVLDYSDLILTCSKEYYKDLIKIHKNVIQINHAYDERNFNQKEFNSRKFDVSFCGSIIIKKISIPKRFNILKQINSNFDKLNICGRMNLYYKELLNFQNLNNYLQIKKILKKPVYGADYLKCYQIQKFVLTLMQIIKSSGNMRLFDVTGQGSLLLTDKTKDSHKFFIPDKECVEFDNADEAIDKING